MNNNVVEKTLKSIDNIDRLSDLAAISIYNTSHEAIDKFDVMQEHATPEYVEGEFVQESLLTGVLIGAGIIGVAISAFLIIKKIIESKAKGDPNAASNTVAGVNLLNPEEINKLFDGWNDKYFKNHPDLVVENAPGADVGELGRYNSTLLEAIRGFCDEATKTIDGLNELSDADMKEAIDNLNKQFDSSINMDELVSKTGRVDKNTILQIKAEAENISKTLREFDMQVTKCIEEFRNKEKNNQNSGSDSEENKISEENIKLLEKALKAKAGTAGAIMDNFRNKCLDGIAQALDAKVKEAEGQAKAKQQQELTPLTDDEKQTIVKSCVNLIKNGYEYSDEDISHYIKTRHVASPEEIQEIINAVRAETNGSPKESTGGPESGHNLSQDDELTNSETDGASAKTENSEKNEETLEPESKFDDTQVTPEKIEAVVSAVEARDPDLTLTDHDRKYIDWFLSANDKDSGISSIIKILESRYKDILNSNESGKIPTFKKYLYMAEESAKVNGFDTQEIEAAFPQKRFDLLGVKSENTTSDAESSENADQVKNDTEGTSKTEPEKTEETPANETEKKDETSSKNTEEKSHDLDIQYSMGEDGKRHIRVINNGKTDDVPIYWPEEFDESANKIIKAAVARGENIDGSKPVFGAIIAVNQIYLLGHGDIIEYLNFEYSNTDDEYRNSKYEICKFIAEVLGEPPVDQLPTPPTETSEEIKDEESPKTEENESGVKFNNDDFEKDVKERVSKAVAAGIDETAADMVVRAIKMDSYANIENALLKGFSMNKPEDRERYMALYDNLDKALAFFNHGPLKAITENRINEFMTPDEVRNKYKNPGPSSKNNATENAEKKDETPSTEETKVTPETQKKTALGDDALKTAYADKYFDGDKDKAFKELDQLVNYSATDLKRRILQRALYKFKFHSNTSAIPEDIKKVYTEYEDKFNTANIPMPINSAEDVLTSDNLEKLKEIIGLTFGAASNKSFVTMMADIFGSDDTAEIDKVIESLKEGRPYYWPENPSITIDQKSKLANIITKFLSNGLSLGLEDEEATQSFGNMQVPNIINLGLVRWAKDQYAKKPDCAKNVYRAACDMATALEIVARVIPKPDNSETPTEPKTPEVSTNPENKTLEPAPSTENQTHEQTEAPVEKSSEDSDDIKKISDSTGLDEGKVENIYKILKDNSTPDDVKRAFIIDTLSPIIRMPGFNQDMANKSLEINYDYFKRVAEAANIPFEIEEPEISEKDINDIHATVSGTGTEETKLTKIADDLMNSISAKEKDETEDEILNTADTIDSEEPDKQAKYVSAIDNVFKNFKADSRERIKNDIINRNYDLNKYLVDYYRAIDSDDKIIDKDQYKTSRYNLITKIANEVGYTDPLSSPSVSPSNGSTGSGSKQPTGKPAATKQRAGSKQQPTGDQQQQGLFGKLFNKIF